MKTDKELLKEMKRYMLDMKIIGSYVLVEKGLLDHEDVNDIDLVFPDYNRAKGCVSFLKDNGYSNEPFSSAGIFKDYYGNVTKSGNYGKEGNKPFHIMIKEGLKVKNVNEIIASKFERGTKSDLNQIIIACKNSIRKLS